MSLAEQITELEARAAVMEHLAGMLLATLTVNLNDGALKGRDEECTTELRRLLKSWRAHFDLHRADRPPPADDSPPARALGAPLFAEGLPLTWRHGVHQAIFVDGFYAECLISEGLDNRHVFYLGRKDHLMAVDRHTARLLAPILSRFAETGKLPLETTQTVPHGTETAAA
jgi:hypothetical protein